MKIVKSLLVYVLLISSNTFATEVFKCVQPDGKNVFSDKPCPKGVGEEKVTYKDQSWESALEASKPVTIKIMDIKKSDGDTLITYELSNYADSEEFLKLAHKISKQSVYLKKMKLPINNGKGVAVMLITKKEYSLEKEEVRLIEPSRK